MPLIAQTSGVIYQVFKRKGDTLEARQEATDIAKYLLGKRYGFAYQFNFFGAFIQDGLLTKSYVDKYNTLRDNVGIPLAMAQLEASGAAQVSFVKTENPRFDYPHGYLEYRIPPFDITDRHLFLPLAIQRLKYSGCKLQGTGINANSTETTDGGPVIKITRVNQNQIVFSNNTVTTARANTSGLPVRQLTSRDFNAGSGRVSENTSPAPAE